MYLNAEVYTGTPRWTDCITYCNKVINNGGFSLSPSYAELFMADNHTSPEIIFPVCFDGNTLRHGVALHSLFALRLDQPWS